jgi:hypothetical protein
MYLYRIGTFKNATDPSMYLASSEKAMYQNLFRHLCLDRYSGLSLEIYRAHNFKLRRDKVDNAIRFTEFVCSLTGEKKFFFGAHEMSEEDHEFWDYSILNEIEEEFDEEEEEWNIPDDGYAHPWVFEGKTYVVNAQKCVWEINQEGLPGKWVGMFDTKKRIIDRTVEEPEYYD